MALALVVASILRALEAVAAVKVALVARLAAASLASSDPLGSLQAVKLQVPPAKIGLTVAMQGVALVLLPEPWAN